MDTFAQKLVCGFCVKVMKLEEKVFFLCLLTLSWLMGLAFGLPGGGVGWLRVVCALGVGVSGCKRWKRVSAKWKIE